MANQLYFTGTVNSVSGLYRVNSLAGTARVDLPDGIEDTFVSSIDPTSPIFTVVNDAGGRDLLELLDTGELVRLTDDAGAQITVASGEGIAFGDGVVFFEGTVGGEEAIWSRAADGIVTKVTDALDSGKMFEFNAGRIWVDSTSDLDSPDGLDHSAVSRFRQMATLNGLRSCAVRRSFGILKEMTNSELWMRQPLLAPLLAPVLFISIRLTAKVYLADLMNLRSLKQSIQTAWKEIFDWEISILSLTTRFSMYLGIHRETKHTVCRTLKLANYLVFLGSWQMNN